MSVSDTGLGMSEDVRAPHLRAVLHHQAGGQGTGLGLAMVYGAVQQNGGTIEVDSAPGRGTSFRILLPEARGDEGRRRRRRTGRRAARPETVLLVEDEAAVRDVTARAARVARATACLSCANAAEALVVAAGHVEPCTCC